MRWKSAPTESGWYVVERNISQFRDLFLVRFEGGACYSEIGAQIGTPLTVGFDGAKWLGPVERP